MARVEVRPQYKRRKKRGKRLAVRKKREVKLSLRWAEVTPPTGTPAGERSPVAGPGTGAGVMVGWAVLAREECPPEGEEALRWVILSSEPVGDADAARRVLGLYRCRWCIEEWHRCLKEGCGIEKARLKDAQGIARLAAVVGPVGARLMYLRDVARDVRAGHKPPSWREVVPPHVLRVVAKLAERDPGTLEADVFWLTIARRGGYLARKGDPPPGWGAIWHGWREVTLLAQGLALAEGAGGGGRGAGGDV